MAITGAWDFFRTKVFTFNNLGINLLIGLTVALVLLAFSDSPWLMEMEDASMDWYMQLNKNIIPSNKEKNIPSFVWLDIDDRTYRKWGESLTLPRDKITDLINTAISAKPRLVIVNLDFTNKTPVETLSLHPHDQSFKMYLTDYVTQCKTKADKSTCPPIILTRAFQKTSSNFSVPCSSFLDSVVTKSAPYVQWAATQFYESSDRVIRRWKLWEPTCANGKYITVIPSIELLASFLLSGFTTEYIQKTLNSFQSKKCSKSYVSSEYFPKNINIGELKISTNKRSIYQRIMYRISWLDLLVDEAGTPVLTVLPAQHYTKLLHQAKLEALTNNIVIIGTSYREGYDLYLTPLDNMPKTLILINSLHSLLQNETIDLSLVTNMLTLLLFIFILTIFLCIFPSTVGIIILGVLTVFGILPLSMLVFHYGMWFSFALPLFVITIYQLIKVYTPR